MTLEVKSAVKNCKQCLHHDGDSIRAPLVPIEAMGPMDLLHLDFTKIEVSGNDRYRVPKFPHSSATFNIISGSVSWLLPKSYKEHWATAHVLRSTANHAKCQPIGTSQA